MEMRRAQQDMRRAYVGGAPGVLVSGLVWSVTGLIWLTEPLRIAFSALFVGGVLIFPLSVAISRLAFRRAAAVKDNPLNRLGLESTFVLFAGIMISYVLLARDPRFSIPAFALVMGARYAAFATIYGNRLYWFLGGGVSALGLIATLAPSVPPGNIALWIGGWELLLAAVMAASGARSAT